MLGGFGSSTSAGLASGGTVDGDLVVTGDFKVEGAGSFAFDEIVEGTLQVNGNLTIANTSGDSQFIINTASRSIVLGSQTFVRNLNNTFEYGNTSGLTDHKFFTNTTQRVTINDTGMGLGTSSPEVLLHLDSSSTTELRIQDGTDKKLRIKQQNNGAFFTAETGNSLTFTTNGNNTAMVIDTSQRVGIGGVSPNSDYALTVQQPTGTNKDYILGVQDNGSNTAFKIDTDSGDNVALRLYNGSGAEKIRFDAGGVSYINNGQNFGINTESPSSHLHIEYTDNTTTSTDSGAGLYEKGLQIENTSTTTSAYSQLHLRAGTSDGYIRYIYNNTNDGRFGFYTDNTNNVQEMMTITNAGLIGIGTNSPVEKLDISAGNIRLDNQQLLTFATTDGNSGRVGIQGDEDSDFLRFRTDNAIRFQIDNNSRISLSNNDSSGTTTNTVFGRLVGANGTMGSNNAFFGDTVANNTLTADADANSFTAYADITKDDAIAWTKAALGSDEVTAIETKIASQITESKTPTVSSGVPW